MGIFNFFKKKEVDEVGNPIDNNAFNDSQSNATPFVDMNDLSFRMTIEDTFSITGRGTVVTGVVELGTIKLGDNVIICRQNGENISTVVTGVKKFRKLLDQASVGDNIGLLLRGISKDMVSSGDIITKPQN